MCQFKSGVILKNNVKIAEGADDSHSNLLESLGIEDNYINATKMFVRAELVPKNGAWWISPKEEPDKWKFIVDQDIVPGWFDDTEYEQRFREAVCAWWDEHIFVDRKIDELNSGYYRLKRCEVKKLCKDVVVMLDSSTVQEMCGSSTVQRMYDSSTVQVMLGSSTARDFRNYPKIKIIFPPDGEDRFEMVALKKEDL